MKSTLLLALILTFFGWNSNAQWVTANTGLTNQSVVPMVTNGTDLYAGTLSGGVFLSTNGGTSWTAVNNGITTLDIYSMTVSGSNVYAGTSVGGVFMTTNNGASWTEVNNGLTSLTIYGMTSNGSAVFAGTFGGGVFRSTDNGATWTAVNTGLTNLEVFTVYANGPNLYAGTTNGGVFLSTNNGNTWTAISTGINSSTIRSLMANGSNLFAGTFGGGIFVSSNNGTSWTPANAGLLNMTVWTMLTDGTDIYAGTYGGGIFLSTNNGASWNPVNTGLPSWSDIWAINIIGTNIYIGLTGPGVYRRPLSELVLVNTAFSYTSLDYCADAANQFPTVTGAPGGSFTTTVGLIMDPSTGQIDVGASTPGTYTVTYTIGGSSSNQTVTINALGDPSFAYSATDFCVNGPNELPVFVTEPGGVFSSSTGVVFANTTTGEIDITASTLGTHIVSYTTGGICPNTLDVSITINAEDDATFSFDSTNYCRNDGDPTPLVSGTGGGIFSSTVGLSLNPSTGEIDLSASMPGLYIITYQTAGICPNSSFMNVLITEVDNSTTLAGTTISANTAATGVTFQWLDCDNGMSPISGETSSSFTATANGNYAVEVTENGCVDTSACEAIITIGFDENTLSGHFKVYPNPTDGVVFIEFDQNQSKLEVNVYALDGKLIHFNTFETGAVFELDLVEPTGVYLLEISDEAGSRAVVRLIRE